MDELRSTFSLSIYFALGGGLLSSLFMIGNQYKNERIMTVLLVLLSVVMSATLADYLFPPQPWLYAGTGIFVGMLSSALLDALKAMAPKLAGQVIHAVGDVVMGFIQKFGNKNNNNEK